MTKRKIAVRRARTKAAELGHRLTPFDHAGGIGVATCKQCGATAVIQPLPGYGQCIYEGLALLMRCEEFTRWLTSDDPTVV
jgi:hypothetical protein